MTTQQQMDQALTDLKTALDERAQKRYNELETKFNNLQNDFDALSVQSKKIAIPGGNTFEQQLTKNLKEHQSDLLNLRKGGSVQFEIKAASDMTFTNVFANAAASITQVRPGVIAPPRRRIHIRQITPMGGMSTSNFAFVGESSFDGDFAITPEGTAKPQLDFKLSENTVKSQYIAGWVRVSKQMFEDIPALSAYVGSRLMERYLSVEDSQILYGDGTGSNLTGINTVATSNSSTAANDFDRIFDAMASIESQNYMVTGILINPIDFYAIAKLKATGSGEYDAPLIVDLKAGQLTFNGVNVYATTAITQGNYLLGDFSNGTQLMIRESPVIQIFEQDGTNVQQNLFTIRCEGRIALPVYHPGAFVKGTFVATT